MSAFPASEVHERGHERGRHRPISVWAVAANYPFRSALVTGASSGIGEAVVRRLAADGVTAVVVARREDRLRALADELEGVEVLPADLTDERSLARVRRRLSDGGRPIDLLVNDAGFGTSGLVADLDPARLRDEIRVNVLALTSLTTAALPGMIERQRGWVLNVSSVAGFQAVPGLAVYAATKAFVTSFTEALHEELRGTGVRATALCPGLTRTEFIDVSRGIATGSAGLADVATRHPDPAWLTADAVAAEGLRDVARGRALSIPGLQYKALVATTLFVPRSIKRRVTGLARSFTR
jgi:short-subunit dehydrogenase